MMELGAKAELKAGGKAVKQGEAKVAFNFKIEASGHKVEKKD